VRLSLVGFFPFFTELHDKYRETSAFAGFSRLLCVYVREGGFVMRIAEMKSDEPVIRKAAAQPASQPTSQSESPAVQHI
jgi:hypothetical protein